MCYILCRKWSVDSGVVAQSPSTVEGDADINYGLVSQHQSDYQILTHFHRHSLELEDLRQSVLSGRVAAAARRDSLEVRRHSRAEAGALSR